MSSMATRARQKAEQRLKICSAATAAMLLHGALWLFMVVRQNFGLRSGARVRVARVHSLPVYVFALLKFYSN